MNKFTRRRNHVNAQKAGSMHFVNPFVTKQPVVQEEETFEESENKINAIIDNVQTTRLELQEELEIYEKKLTILETEFIQYQKLAMKVVAALKMIDNITVSLTENEKEKNNDGVDGVVGVVGNYDKDSGGDEDEERHAPHAPHTQGEAAHTTAAETTTQV